MTRRRFPFGALVALGVALAAFCLACGDRQGFEGDDVAMLFGIGHLDRIGAAEVYRYHWQPLTYELLAPLARRLGSAFELMPLGNLAGALGLTLLVAVLTCALAGVPRRLAIGALLVVCVPEFVTTALYFNSTALALPFFTGSLLALDAAQRRGGRWPMSLLSGALGACACLVRLDFATAMPFALAAAWAWSDPPRRKAVAAAWLLGGSLVALLALVCLPDLPAGAFAILRGYQGGEFPISRFYSLRTLLVTLGPATLVFAALALGLLPMVRGGGVPQRLGTIIAPAVAMAPTLAPIIHLYSGKYLIPFLACFVTWAAHVIAQLYEHGGATDEAWCRSLARPIGWGWVIVASTAFAGIPAPAPSVSGSALNVFVEPRRFRTHDGPRTAGAYLAAARSVRVGGFREPYVDVWRELADLADACGRSVAIVMPTRPPAAAAGWSWTFLPLYLERLGWRIEHIELTARAHLVKPGTPLVLDIYRPGQVPAPAPGTAAIDMTQVPEAPDAWAEDLAWVRTAGRAGPDGLPRACALR